MTAAEYIAALNRARNQRPTLTAATMRKIRAIYREQGQKVAAIIREGGKDGDQLDRETHHKVDQALLEGSAAVGQVLRDEIPALIASVAALSIDIETRFMWDAWNENGEQITEAGLRKMFKVYSDKAIQASMTEIIKGENFLMRVPNISRYFSDDVVSMVQAALAQGRDVGKIAADVNVFIKDGKQLTISRWGDILEPRSSELLKRIRFDKVDYRALRLARTELGRALEKTALTNGAINPGALDLYDWVRVNAIDWGCVCPGNAANGPYPRAEYPTDRHPSCFCYPRVHLRDGTEFRDELKRWANRESVPALDSWFRGTYLPAQYGA